MDRGEIGANFRSRSGSGGSSSVSPSGVGARIAKAVFTPEEIHSRGIGTALKSNGKT